MNVFLTSPFAKFLYPPSINIDPHLYVELSDHPVGSSRRLLRSLVKRLHCLKRCFPTCIKSEQCNEWSSTFWVNIVNRPSSISRMRIPLRDMMNDPLYASSDSTSYTQGCVMNEISEFFNASDERIEIPRTNDTLSPSVPYAKPFDFTAATKINGLTINQAARSTKRPQPPFILID